MGIQQQMADEFKAKKHASDRLAVEQAVRESSTLAGFIESLAFKRLCIDDLTDMERGVIICRYLANEAEMDCGEIFHTMSQYDVYAMFLMMGEGDTLSAGAVFLQSAGRSPFTADVLNKYAKRYEERQQDNEDPRTDDRITEIRENRNG